LPTLGKVRMQEAAEGLFQGSCQASCPSFGGSDTSSTRAGAGIGAIADAHDFHAEALANLSCGG